MGEASGLGAGSVLTSTVPEASIVQTLGERLRETREARGLSVDEVARVIRFSPRQIEAMENDDFEKLPGLTVIRGFIRSYAKLLKLEVEPLLALFDRQAPVSLQGTQATRSMASMTAMTSMGTLPKASGQRRRKGYLLLAGMAAFVIFLGFGVFHFIAPSLMGEASTTMSASKSASSFPAAASHEAMAGAATTSPAHVPAAAVDTREALLASPVASPVSPSSSGSIVSSSSSPSSNASPALSSSPDSTSQTATPTVSTGTTVNPVLATGGEKMLTFDFDETAWLEVRDANKKMLVAQNNLRGTQKVVSGQPPFSIVVGNASQVRLRYDDQVIDLKPWTRVDVARLTLE